MNGKSETVAPMTAPWRCRHGWHRWQFVSLSNVRMIEVPGHSSWVGCYSRQCVGCGLRNRQVDHRLPLSRSELQVETIGRSAPEQTA